MGKYFGTDGIRGVANTELDAALAYKAGFAAAHMLSRPDGAPRFLIGRDTRLSGDFLEAALAAGLCAAGGHVTLAGVLPTPAVAYGVVRHGFDAGVVISASHNPFAHNGIKFFGAQGYKLTDEQELALEQLIDAPPSGAAKTGALIGRIERTDDVEQAYIEHIARSAPCELSGLRVLVDCANGAAARTARRLFASLGASADFLHDAPDGVNINENCGSTHMGELARRVADGGYDAGVAFDGDADRCLLVDERGQLVDGDRILGLMAVWLKRRGRLSGGVVATVMSNIGLWAFLRQNGIDIVTTAVGDRYVLEEMRRAGHNLGGEQSGHVILSDYATTGDGQLTAVQMLAMLRESAQPLGRLASLVPIYPQVMRNVRVPNSRKHGVKDWPAVREVEREIAQTLGGDGRVLIRASGTEALVRVMVEGKDMNEIERLCARAAWVIEAEAAK